MTTTVVNIRDLPEWKRDYLLNATWTKPQYQQGNHVYIGRPSKWGNPFAIGKDGTREEVVEKFRLEAETGWPPFDDLSELKDKVLVCFCAPLPCHGDVLAELADA